MADILTEWQRWYWQQGGRQIKVRYYARQTKTKAGLARLAEYKRYRRRAIRAGIWRTSPESRP